MILVVVGSIEPANLLEKVTQAFGDWQNPQQPEPPPLPPVKPLPQVVTSQVEVPGKAQMDIVIGAAGPARKYPDFQAANLGNSILGQFGMMGRLGDLVREKEGLAYHISSSVSGGPGPGPWDISAGVDIENMQQAIDLITSEVRRFTSELVLDEELEDVKAHFIGRLPLSLESNFGVARALMGLERYDLGMDYYHHYANMIHSITKEEILLAAQHYLDPDRLAIAMAGTFNSAKDNSETG
jgi:zinc protease